MTSTPTQRYTTLGGILLTMLLLAGVYSAASKPRYAMLYGGLSTADQASIVTEIQTLGVPVKYDVPGNVEVPESEVANLRMKLVASGKVPKGAHIGLENLGEMNLTTTPAVERERLKAIAEGELAKSIETNPAIRSARVHITLGDPSPFVEQQRPPSAAVSLITNGSTAVNSDSARGIAMLVSNSIDGLDMKNVVVLDENAKPLYDGSQLEAANAVASHKIEMEQAIAKREELRLQANLDDIFGLGNTKVSIRCEVDLDEVKKKINSRVLKKGVATKSMTEEMNGGARVNSPAGISSNGASTQAPTTIDEEGKEKYNSKVEQVEPNITETEEVKNQAMGSLKSMMINVAANTAGVKAGEGEDIDEKRTEFVQKVTEFVQAEIATKSTTEPANFQSKVTAVAFDNSTKNAMTQSQDEAASAARFQQIMSMLPIAALLLVGFMVVKQLGKMTRTSTQVVTPDGQVFQVPMVNGQFPNNYAMVNGAQDEINSMSIQPYDKPPAIDTEILTEGLESGRFSVNSEGGIVFHDEDEILEVKKIREKKSANLAAIKQMAGDRPEATAMLIKSWLSEDDKYQR
jgi:flagellar M-ring protein FliF